MPLDSSDMCAVSHCLLPFTKSSPIRDPHLSFQWHRRCSLLFLNVNTETQKARDICPKLHSTSVADPDWTKTHSRQPRHPLREPASFQETFSELSSVCSFSFFLFEIFVCVSSNHSPFTRTRPLCSYPDDSCVPGKVQEGLFHRQPLNFCPRHGPCLSDPLSLLTTFC